MGAKRKTWLDAAFENFTTEQEPSESARQAIALACAPVKTAPRFDPLDMTGVPTFSVWIEPVKLAEIGAPVSEEVSGMRAYLKRPQAWGPTRKVSVLMEGSMGLVRFLIEAPMGAIAHAVPDRETLKSWIDAAAIAVPLMLDPEPSDEPMRFVAPGDTPRVLQVEYASRSTFDDHQELAGDDDVTHGSQDAEPSAKDVARAAVGLFDVRAELGALAYKGVGLGS
jgi:hypothetical protein